LICSQWRERYRSFMISGVADCQVHTCEWAHVVAVAIEPVRYFAYICSKHALFQSSKNKLVLILITTICRHVRYGIGTGFRDLVRKLMDPDVGEEQCAECKDKLLQALGGRALLAGMGEHVYFERSTEGGPDADSEPTETAFLRASRHSTPSCQESAEPC
jgi:hypothetical protein